MTRRGINILLSIFSIVLSLSLFGFGVYASVAVTSTVNNTFFYEVPDDNFSVDIWGKITGCKNEGNFSEFLRHYKDSEITQYPNSYNVEFLESDQAGVYKDIVFTFKIANNNAFPITVEIQSDTQSAHFSSTPSSSITIGEYYFDQTQQKWVAPEGEVKLTLKLTTVKENFKETNSFTLHFAKAD